MTSQENSVFIRKLSQFFCSVDLPWKMLWELFGSFWLRSHLPSLLQVSWIFAFSQTVSSFFVLFLLFCVPVFASGLTELPGIDDKIKSSRRENKNLLELWEGNKVIKVVCFCSNDFEKEKSLSAEYEYRFEVRLRNTTENTRGSTLFALWRRRLVDLKGIIQLFAVAMSRRSNFQNREQKRHLFPFSGLHEHFFYFSSSCVKWLAQTRTKILLRSWKIEKNVKFKSIRPNND